jgi:hypothetical protein
MDDRPRHTLKIMETQTAFDLNLAIRRWREDLAGSSAFRSENLNELESHLRDSIDRLRARELSDEEAFLIATRRVGNTQRLEQEFGKVNSAAVWFDRCLWILVAAQLWSFLSSMSSFLLSAALPLCIDLNEILPGFGLAKIQHDSLQYGLAIIMSPIPTVILAALLWRFFIWPKRKGAALVQKLLRQPANLALTLFLLCSTMHIAAAWALQAWYYPASYSNVWIRGIPWGLILLWQLPMLGLWAGLTYFVARKRVRSSMA